MIKRIGKGRTGARVMAGALAAALVFTSLPANLAGSVTAKAAETVTQTDSGYLLENEYFKAVIGKYGEISSLKLTGDEFDTDYVLNAQNAAAQGDSKEHQWMGELMFQTKTEGQESWSESMTSASAADSSARKITKDGNKIVVTYDNESAEKGIRDFKLTETYELVNDKLQWSIKVENDNDKNLTFGDFGLPMPFNEYWSGTQGYVYEERVVDHSFVGQDSSYIYATRASGQGRFLLFTPEVSTGAKLEYQDHWRVNNGHEGSVWAQDQGGWANGLNVFYIHSNVIKSTGSSYLENTELTLAPGESKTYTFNFSPALDEDDMKTTLYEEGILDAVAVPSMVFSKNMPAQFYLHTKYANENITSIEIKCLHDTKLYEGLENSVSNKLDCTKTGSYAQFKETKIINGENYHIYDLKLNCLGANHLEIHYKDKQNNEKISTLQFYVMDNAEDALNLHADFVTKYTQVDNPGDISDMIFDDWMMDTKKVRGAYSGYFGWGDDWGFTHGEYLAEKNVYLPVKEQIQAVDNYLDIAIWNGLMREHHEDYLVNDWLDYEPNSTGQGTSRGYAYPHVYNTYFSMYKVAEKYPDMIDYKESKETYLLRAANVLKALYSDGVGYNWDTGLMGESTTPDIIAALEKQGFYQEASDIRDIMTKKYESFKNQKYPYGSEYSYDNTGEEAVYTLAKLMDNSEMMNKIDLKTRACRGVQPIWYHYGNPTTICGENWWNFQYSASLIGYCMDDWLRLEDTSRTEEERAEAERVNYAAKLANLTSINSGQIDADSKNVGTVAWTYQSELGNSGGQGTGGGNIHNGWRQMSGEADTGLFGAMRILSSDVATDPVFGLFGYGCEVTKDGSVYTVKPLDGLYTRLNLINEKLYIELNRDQYSLAKLSDQKDSVVLTVKNLEETAHDIDMELTGLKAGTYNVKVNDKVSGSFKVLAEDETVMVTVALPAAKTAEVKIEKGKALSNTAPEVKAGEDKEIEISDTIRLNGEASDDGYPNMSMTNKWTVVTKPEGSAPVIANDDKLISDITFDKVGTYVLKLIVSDGELESSDSVTIEVTEDIPLPDTFAYYTFDNLDEQDLRNRQVPSADAEAAGFEAERISNPSFTAGKEENGKALTLTGEYCGYVRMPAEITKKADEVTISLDVKMDGSQGAGAKLFEFRDTDGRYLNASVVNGNEITVNVTDRDTKEVKSLVKGVKTGVGYWKNIEITIKDGTLIFYMDGVKKGEISECNFKLSDLEEVQRNFIGRGDNKTDSFFKGQIDNFTMQSKALTEAEINDKFGTSGAANLVSAEVSDLVTMVGQVPVLPSTVAVLYDNGEYDEMAVEWEYTDPAVYNQRGTVTVLGKVAGLSEAVSVTIYVVEGQAQNVAAFGVPSAIYNNVNDLGGVAGLNDGYEPQSSKDTSHGVWHNWGGAQGAPAWVQYDFDEPVIITESDAYYFKDGGGNFQPTGITYEYKDENGVWKQFTNAEGMTNNLDVYNKTTFDPVVVTAIRMNMSPVTLGCGVIEWKVFGYSDKVSADKQELKIVLDQVSALPKDFVESGWEELESAVENANAVASDAEASQELVDAAAALLKSRWNKLVPKDGNQAYVATVSTSYVSSWESLSAVNDGIVSETSAGAGVKHYGTWGNESAYETVTYSWPAEKKLSISDVYFFNDGGGIKTPAEYQYEYHDKNNDNWHTVSGAAIEAIVLDEFNTTNLEEIVTNSIRIKMIKQASDVEGVGIIEWKILGENSDAAAEYGNVALKATPSAQHTCLDGQDAHVKALNNGVDPTSSASDQQYFGPDASQPNIVWHNWNQCDDPVNPEKQDKTCYVQYDWANPVKINEARAYYMCLPGDLKGQWTPGAVEYQYLTEDGSWVGVSNPQGLGVEINQYNVTTFDEVTTKGLRMVMTKAEGVLGLGVLEWQVMGQEVVGADKAELLFALAEAAGKMEADYTDDTWQAFLSARTAAEELNKNMDAAQDEVDAAAQLLTETMAALTEKEEQPEPEGLEAAATSDKGLRDGKITGVTTAMEYKVPGSDEFISCTGTEIIGLTAGTYYVRFKGTETKKPGKAAKVIVPDGEKENEKEEQPEPAGLKGIAPSYKGLRDGKITGVTTAMEYRESTGETYISCTGNAITGLASGDYYVRFKETETKKAGKAVKVNVPEGKKKDNSSSSSSDSSDKQEKTEEPEETADKTIESKADSVTTVKKQAQIKVSVAFDDYAKARKDNPKDDLIVELPKEEIIRQLEGKAESVSLEVTIPDALAEDMEKDTSKLQLTKDIILEAKKQQKEVSIEVKDSGGNFLAGWEIDGSIIGTSDKNLKDLILNVNTSTAKQTQKTVLGKILNKDKKNSSCNVISLEHKGTFGCAAKVSVNLEKKAGKTVYLYLVNEKTGKYESLPDNKYKVSKSGKLTIQTNKGGTYAVLSKKPSQSMITSSVSNTIVNTAAENIKASKTVKISAAVPTDTKAKIVYTAKDKKVAKVDKNGKVTGVKKGTTTISIKVTIEGKTKTYSKKIVVK